MEIFKKFLVNFFSSLRRWKPALIIFGVWLVAGLLYSAQSYYYRTQVGQAVTWRDILVYDATYFVLWAFFTPLLSWLARRFRIERTQWLLRSLAHVFLAFGIAIIHRAIYDAIFMPLRQTPERPFTWERLYYSVIGSFDYGMLVYFIVLMVHHALDYYRRFQDEQIHAARLQAELSTARLQALEMQLHPHFLFNTLNTIAVLIREDPARAGRVVEMLGDLLRHTLARANCHEITLSQELEWLQLYLQIEQTRFGERLRVQMNVAPETLPANVPMLVLQPVVENAVRHGVAKRRGLGVIEISAERQNGELRLRVQDNGYGFDENGEESQNGGIGLANTRARLKTLYGESSRLELEEREGGGVVATVVMPFRVANGEA